MKKKKQSSSKEHLTWMPMTDMLSSTLMITFLFIAVSTILRAMNAKPPVIKLEDTEEYRFGTGSFRLSEDFKTTLLKNAVPKIQQVIECYGVDTIEIIGHTDGRPGATSGNLDRTIEAAIKNKNTYTIKPGSNLDLGFLRALSVKNEIENQLINQNMKEVGYRVLSAGSTIDKNGYLNPGKNADERSRRRIEIRFLRTSNSPFIPRCS